MATIPKIALIPSGVKAGKLYSVLPTNGAGDFTTTRASVATRVNENGLIEEVAANVPRLDYSDGTCPSLLLEPTATNLIIYSEDFSNTSWNKTSIGTGSSPSVTVNQGLAPDGALNADRIVLDLNGGTTSSDYSFISDTVPINSGGVISLSIYLKSNTGSTQNLIMWEATTGTSLSCVVTNEWKRFNIIATVTSTSPGLNFGLRNAFGVTVDDTADVLAWGAQLEANSYATSLIKTVGSATTRSADTANGAGDASTFNDSEGVLMAELSALANNSIGSRAISLSDGGGSNRVYFFYDNFNRITVQIISSTVNVFSFTHTLTNQEEVIKLAFNYKANNISLFINGIEIKKDGTVTSMPLNLNRLGFDSGGGFSDFYGNTKQIQYFDSALNDTELEKLTSWTSFTAMANALNYTII